MGPPRENVVDVPQGRVKGRFVVPAVVVDPTSDVRVEHPREIVQGLVAALVKCPAPDRLPDRLESLITCCRAERDAHPISTPSRQPRPERIAEEVRGGRLRRDSVSVPLSGASAGWVDPVPLPGCHAEGEARPE